MRGPSLLATSVFAFTLPGCTLSEPEYSVSSSTQALTGSNRLAGNRLAGNRLAGNRLAGNRLAGNRLAGNRLAALDETAGILTTEEGRDVYSYIVSCALPEGVTIEADVPDAEDTPPDAPYTCIDGRCTFSGLVGLAPQWIDHPLDNDGKAWVSACLFARVNAYNVPETVSLRGRHSALEVTNEEKAQYTLQEGAFYGNLFIDDPDPNAPPDWNACRGQAKAACMGEGCGRLSNRDCAAENPETPGYTYCGFKYAGDCGIYDPWHPTFACLSYNATKGYYGDCAVGDEDNWWRWLGPIHANVVTTWVRAN